MKSVRDVETDIKNLTIQGATNVALAVLDTLEKYPDKSVGERVAYARPTEPLAQNAIRYIFSGNDTKKRIQQYKSFIMDATKSIPENGKHLLKSGGTYLTLCHSQTTIDLIQKARAEGAKFRMFVAETRPLYQGRTTATELISLGFNDVTMVTDSVAFALLENNTFDAVFLGADLITESGFVNKVGSLAATTIANLHAIPVFCASTLLKFSPKPIRIEERNPNEIWESPPEGLKFYAPAFDYIPFTPNVRVVCEDGILLGEDIALAVKKRYLFIME